MGPLFAWRSLLRWGLIQFACSRWTRSCCSLAWWWKSNRQLELSLRVCALSYKLMRLYPRFLIFVARHDTAHYASNYLEGPSTRRLSLSPRRKWSLLAASEKFPSPKPSRRRSCRLSWSVYCICWNGDGHWLAWKYLRLKWLRLYRLSVHFLPSSSPWGT